MIIASAGLGAVLAWRFIGNPEPPPAREDIVLARAELRSNLPGQPFPEGRVEIVDAKAGHPPGHIVYSLPRRLPNGSYRLVMTTAVLTATTENSCIMDLLAGDRLIANTPLIISRDDDGIDFTSPAPNGATDFVARLFCNGHDAVRVYQVRFIRNPKSSPAVVWQR